MQCSSIFFLGILTLCQFGLTYPNHVDDLELTILHFNDFHARFDEQSPSSGVCKPNDECHGGFARLYQAIMDIYSTAKNPILLNSGDNFQGTLWYTLFRWNVTQYFMNMLPIKAYTLGNHEFDDGIDGLVPFLKASKAPCLVCNIDDTNEPDFQGLCQKSMIIEIEGKKIGLVGVALSTTDEISNTEDLIFLDESESINAEAERLVREEDVHSVIVISHAGYQKELEIARKATKRIALIVGGHTHTFLNNGTGEDGSVPEGPYPTIVERDLDNQGVPVVQASAYTKYLGNLHIVIGPDGEAKSWNGKPIYLSPSLPKNKEILELLQPFKDEVDAQGKKVLGSTEVHLEQCTCRTLECNLGNLITDAMVFAYKDKALPNCWTYASLAIMNSGGIRSSIPVGNITYNDLISVQPFGNTFDIGLLKGEHIKGFLERAATPFMFRDGQANVHLLQLSGFRVVYDLSKEENDRVVDVKLLCADCPEPIFEDLDLSKEYKVIVPSFLGCGGDGFTVISENLANYTTGEHDMDVFERYLATISPVEVLVDVSINNGSILFPNLKGNQNKKTCKNYNIKKYAMVERKGTLRTHEMNHEENLMRGEPLELCVLPGIQSSMLVSVLWVSCVIFVTVMFTYIYAAIYELLWL